MESTGNINGIVFVGKIADIGFDGIFIQSQGLTFRFQPGTDGVCIQHNRFTSKCVCNCSTPVFFQLTVQTCNFIFHIFCCCHCRADIYMFIQRDCDCISKKSCIKCRIQICVHGGLQFIRINLRALYLFHKDEFFFLLIVLNGCIGGRFSFFRSEIGKIQSLFFLLLIFLDLAFQIYVFFLWKNLPVLFSLFLKVCKLIQKIFLIEAVPQIFERHAVNLLVIFLKRYRPVFKFRSNFFFCLLCVQPGNLHSPHGNFPAQCVVICHVCVAK